MEKYKRYWNKYKYPILGSILWVLNLLDALFTKGLIEHGLAYEANPLMAYLINIDMWLFLLAKIAVGTAACLSILFIPINRFTQVLLSLAILVYALVVLNHVQILLASIQ